MNGGRKVFEGVYNGYYKTRLLNQDDLKTVYSVYVGYFEYANKGIKAIKVKVEIRKRGSDGSGDYVMEDKLSGSTISVTEDEVLDYLNKIISVNSKVDVYFLMKDGRIHFLPWLMGNFLNVLRTVDVGMCSKRCFSLLYLGLLDYVRIVNGEDIISFVRNGADENFMMFTGSGKSCEVSRSCVAMYVNDAFQGIMEADRVEFRDFNGSIFYVD